MSDCRSRGHKLQSQLANITFLVIYHKIISKVILPLLLIQKEQLSVTCERAVCKNTAELLRGLSVCRLILKAPRKTASENVVCLCRLLNILANFSKLFFAYRQTVWTQIRLLLKEQSDLGPHCLQKWLLKWQAEVKADDNCCDWRFKG